jgi:hypothetical protein
MDISPLPAGWLMRPEPLTAAEVAAYVVAAAVWAPSVHNTQPWWFSVAGQEISLHADAERQLGVADPRGREMMISCGAALFTARLALRSLGYIPETSVLPDPGRPLLVARVNWRRRAAAAEFEQRLFNQVPLRRTHRGGFDPLPLPADLVAVLQAGAERDGAMLRVIDGEARRRCGDSRVCAASGQRVRAGTGQVVAPAGQQPARRGAAHRLPGAARAHPPALRPPGLRSRPPLGYRHARPLGGAPVRRCRVPADDRQ